MVRSSKTIQKNLLSQLESSLNDLSTTELSQKIGVERHTVAKYLESLYAKGIISYRRVGRSKLWQLSESPLLSIIEDVESPLFKELTGMFSNVSSDIRVQDKDLNILWSNNSKDIGHCCLDIFNIQQPCRDCPVLSSFKSGKEKKQKLSNGTTIIKPLKKNGITVAVLNIRNPA
ncbi:MAG: helix-turn-helix domain-containing protein [Nanobdellota archaeon]